MFEEIGRFIDGLPMAIIRFINGVAKSFERNMSLWMLIMFNVYLVGGTAWLILTSLTVGWWLLLAILPLLLLTPYAIALVRKIRSRHERAA